MRPNLLCLGLLLGLSYNCTVWASDDNQPSMEFLEFLGEWETEDGEWVDPQILESMDAEQQAEEAPYND
jgi:hypothetical protein